MKESVNCQEQFKWVFEELMCEVWKNPTIVNMIRTACMTSM